MPKKSSYCLYCIRHPIDKAFDRAYNIGLDIDFTCAAPADRHQIVSTNA